MHIVQDLLDKKPIQLTDKTRVTIAYTYSAPLTSTEKILMDTDASEDNLILLNVMGERTDEYEKTRMNHENRYQATREAFINNPFIFVSKLNLDELETSKDLLDFNNHLLSYYTRGTLSNKLYIAVDDNTMYLEIFESMKELSDNELVLKLIPTSLSSLILGDPDKYWDEIYATYKRFFRTVVSIVGASSGGKSTLAKNLSNEFNGLVNSEYIRHYNNNNHRYINESNYSARDYMSIISGQLAWSEEILNSNSDEKVVFLDTCPVVTKSYVELSQDSFSLKDFDTLRGMTEIATMWSKNNVELFIEVPYDTEFVTDGLRDGHYADTREEIHKSINQDIYRLGRGESSDLVYLNTGSFDSNTQMAKELVQELLSKPTKLQPLTRGRW